MSNIPEKPLTLTEELQELVRRFTFKNALIYLVGMILIGIGVPFMLRSFVGVSSWDTLHYSITLAFPIIPFAAANIIVASLATITVVVLNRKITYLVMMFPVFITGGFIYIFNEIVFANLEYTTTLQNILGYVLGLSILPLGGSLMIISTLPAGVYDEFMLAILRKVGSTNIPLVRAIIEISVVILAFLIGLTVGHPWGKISYGTVLFSLLFGFYLKFYLTLFERIGMYETKQTN